MKNKILICIFSIFIFNLSFYSISFAQNVYKLSLDEVSKLTMQNNIDIQIAQYDNKIADYDIDIAESIFDIILYSKVGYTNDQRASTSTLAASKTVDNDYNVGLSKKFNSGTTISSNLTNNRTYVEGSSTASAPISHESNFDLTVRQDLGRNFFGNQDRGNIKLTQIDVENVRYTSIDKIETILSVTQKAYWDLVLQYEKVSIQQDMVSQAKKLYDLHQEKLKDGLVEIPEAIASEANYRKRNNSLILEQNILSSRINVLKLMLNIHDDNLDIEPTDKLSVLDSIVDFNVQLNKAFSQRRDYKVTLNKVKKSDISLALKKNNIYPEINLTASFQRNGLGDHFKQSNTNITDTNNPKFYAGLEIEFPLFNTEAKAKLKQAEMDKVRILLNLKYIERKIVIEVMDQVRDCNVLQQIALNSIDITNLQKEKLIEEEKRFNQGRTDTDTIIRYQEDFIQAQFSEAEAKYNYFVSRIELEKRTANLLNNYL